MNTTRIPLPQHFSVEEAAQFREDTYSTLARGATVFEIDFKNCQFIDSTGLGVLVSLYKRCKENNSDMVLYSMNSNIYHLFEMTNLTQVFDIVN